MRSIQIGAYVSLLMRFLWLFVWFARGKVALQMFLYALRRMRIALTKEVVFREGLLLTCDFGKV